MFNSEIMKCVIVEVKLLAIVEKKAYAKPPAVVYRQFSALRFILLSRTTLGKKRLFVTVFIHCTSQLNDSGHLLVSKAFAQPRNTKPVWTEYCLPLPKFVLDFI